VALGVSLLVCGCRAEVGGPDDLGVDAGDDLTVVDLSDVDLTGGGDGPGCPIMSAEICKNGCDDDRNGYTDDDDPACTTQLVVTTQTASPSLSRLILDPAPHLAILDTHMVNNGGMAFVDRQLAPATAYVVFTSGMSIERLVLMMPSMMGTVTNNMTMPAFTTRDVCAFNGDLIVVERGLPSVLHRFKPDGASPINTVSLGNVLATSCASDGKLLYVAVHDTTVGNPSTFIAFDTSFAQQGGAIAMPSGIANFGANGLDRCIDFAYSPRAGFWGLFVNAAVDYSNQPLNDNVMSSGQLFPFAFDGGSGPPVDAGVYHGVGSFIP